jgi:hypothetical protein
MASYNQKQLQYKVLNGNACSLLVGDQVIGFAQTTTQTIDYGTEAIFGVGSAKVGEIQQQKLQPSITLDRMALTAEGVAYFGESTPWASILANTQLDIHVMDNTGNPIFTFVNCTASSFSQSVPANQAVSQATSFLAMDVLDPSGTSILNSNSAVDFNLVASSAGGIVNLAGI